MSRTRTWLPAATMLLVSLVSYIDRNTLALLAPTILKETRLSVEQYGYVIAAFSIVYTVANPFWGRWLDRLGVRRGMTAAVSFWTVASAAHAFASGLVSFGLARAALGFGEGATFPGGLRTVAQTLPPHLRARGIAVAYSGGSLGAVLTPLIVTPIALVWGWRAAFLFTGGVGLAWVLWWQFVSRRPELRMKPEPATPDAAPRLSFKDGRVWSLMLAYAWGALPLALILYAASIYLNRGMGASQGLIGKLLWIPPLGWEAGYFFWGWLSDTRGAGAMRWLMGAAALLSLPLALTPWAGSLWLVMALMFVSMFAAAGFIILSVAYGTHVFSTHHSGLIAGLGAGAWSAMVALIMPVFGRLFDRGRFDAGFALASVFPLAGYAAWLILSRRPSAAQAAASGT